MSITSRTGTSRLPKSRGLTLIPMILDISTTTGEHTWQEKDQTKQGIGAPDLKIQTTQPELLTVLIPLQDNPFIPQEPLNPFPKYPNLIPFLN